MPYLQARLLTPAFRDDVFRTVNRHRVSSEFYEAAQFIASRWHGKSRVRRHRASSPQRSSSKGYCLFRQPHGLISMRPSLHQLPSTGTSCSYAVERQSDWLGSVLMRAFSPNFPKKSPRKLVPTLEMDVSNLFIAVHLRRWKVRLLGSLSNTSSVIMPRLQCIGAPPALGRTTRTPLYRKYRSLGTPPRLTFQARLLRNQEDVNTDRYV